VAEGAQVNSTINRYELLWTELKQRLKFKKAEASALGDQAVAMLEELMDEMQVLERIFQEAKQ
jgi:hypothetical protein